MTTARQQSLKVIVATLAVGQLAFLTVVLVIQKSVVPPEAFDATTLPAVALIVLFSTILASLQIGRMLVAKAAQKADEEAKWSAFQTAVIVRLALPEASSFLAIVFYLLTGEWIFLTFFAVSFGAFLFQRPKEGEWDEVRSGHL